MTTPYFSLLTLLVGTPSPIEKMMSNYGLTHQDCNKVISDQHLQTFSQSQCEKWRYLPSYLTVPVIYVSDTEREYLKEAERRYSFFNKWKLEKKEEATYYALICALLKINSADDAEQLCQLLKNSPSTTDLEFENALEGNGKHIFLYR